jgi:hypothetical protein
MAGKNLKSKNKHKPARPVLKAIDSFSLPIVSFIKDSAILVLTFSNVFSLKSLRRVHECYEGGELKGPLKGVNMPCDVLYNWVYCIGLHRLELNELELWNLIKNLDCTYIIACLKGDTSTLLHEYAHAIYHLDNSYKLLVGELWDNLTKSCKLAIGKELSMRNYKEKVWVDEWQAYNVESCREFGSKWAKELSVSHGLLKSRLGKPMQVNCFNCCLLLGPLASSSHLALIAHFSWA